MAAQNNDNDQTNEMKGILTLDLSKIENKAVESSRQHIGGFKWKVTGGNVPFRHAFILICQCPRPARLFLCQAKFTFEAKEVADGEWHRWPEEGPFFWYNSNNILCKPLIMPDGREAMPIMVRLHIEVVWTQHVTCFPAFDVVLNVKCAEHSLRFPANRHILATHSPVFFHNFFFGEEAELNRQPNPGQYEELEVFNIGEEPSFNPRAFARMLSFLHISAPFVDKDNFLDRIIPDEIIDFINMTVKYKVPMLVHCGEQRIIKRGFGNMEMLAVAENHNLPALKNHCLETIDVLEYAKDFDANNIWRDRLGNETRKLLDQRISETAGRFSRKRKWLEDDNVEEDTVPRPTGVFSVNFPPCSGLFG